MPPTSWDPDQYLRHAGPRSRPFHELLSRVSADAPRRVVDVGCGTGELTALLARRWPGAEVTGLDSSPAMLARCPRGSGAVFRRGDAADLDAGDVDVVVSNACLQWVPQHRELLVRWAGQLPAGGVLAFQVPDNFAAPSHALMRELAGSPAWRDRLAGVLRGTGSVATPAEYLDLLAGAGLRADVWQSEYQHVLDGPDPVLDWVRGTGLRPVLDALDEDGAERFTAGYAALLRAAYPARAWGTPFAFRRTFAVARR